MARHFGPTRSAHGWRVCIHTTIPYSSVLPGRASRCPGGNHHGGFMSLLQEVEWVHPSPCQWPFTAVGPFHRTAATNSRRISTALAVPVTSRSSAHVSRREPAHAPCVHVVLLTRSCPLGRGVATSLEAPNWPLLPKLAACPTATIWQQHYLRTHVHPWAAQPTHLRWGPAPTSWQQPRSRCTYPPVRSRLR